MILHSSVKISQAKSSQIEKRKSLLVNRFKRFLKILIFKNLEMYWRYAFSMLLKGYVQIVWAISRHFYIKQESKNCLLPLKRWGCRSPSKCKIFTHISSFFSKNIGAVSDEHCEWFHQDINGMEERYQGVCY